MAKLSGAEFVAGIVLIAIGFFAAGAGLLQFPPTADSTKLAERPYSAPAWTLDFQFGRSVTFTPSTTANYTGVSLLLRPIGFGPSYDWSFRVKLQQGTTVLMDTTYTATVGGPGWFTFAASELGVPVGLTKGVTYSVFVSVTSGEPSNIGWDAKKDTTSVFYVVWGRTAAAPPPSNDEGDGGNVQVEPCDESLEDCEPTPPPAKVDVGAMAVTAIVLLVVILGLVLLSLGLAGVFG